MEVVDQWDDYQSGHTYRVVIDRHNKPRLQVKKRILWGDAMFYATSRDACLRRFCELATANGVRS